MPVTVTITQSRLNGNRFTSGLVHGCVSPNAPRGCRFLSEVRIGKRALAQEFRSYPFSAPGANEVAVNCQIITCRRYLLVCAGLGLFGTGVVVGLFAPSLVSALRPASGDEGLLVQTGDFATYNT